MRRTLGVLALVVIAVAGCGNERSPRNSGKDSTDRPPQIKPFDVVKLYPEYGPGAPREVGGGRIQPDGEFQILVLGGYNELPTRVEVTESPEAVVVYAFAEVYDDSNRPMVVVPWYVAIDLDSPLGDRSVTSASSGKEVSVMDCALQPEHPWCRGAF